MQQPPYYQQPNVNYPLQMPPPQRKSWFRRHPFWTALIILLCVSSVYGIINGATSTKTDATTPVATSAPTQKTQPTTPPIKEWVTIDTFNGRTHGKTPYFDVKAGWRLEWQCDNSTVPSGDTGAVGITAYDRTGRTLSGNATGPTVATGHCPPTFFGTSGTSGIQKYGGTMLLDVYATGDWTINIQTLQ